MKCSDRTLSIFLQVVEIGSIEAVGNAVQNAEMQLQWFFDLIKNPSEETGVDIARHFFHFPVTEKVDVELWPQLFQPLGERHAVIAGICGNSAGGQMAGEKLAQNRTGVGRMKRNSLVNNHGFNAAVQDRCEHGVLKGGYEYWLIHKFILWSPQFAEILRQLLPRCPACRTYNQHLEIRPMCGILARTGHTFAEIDGRLILTLPISNVAAIRMCQQRVADRLNQASRTGCVP